MKIIRTVSYSTWDADQSTHLLFLLLFFALLKFDYTIKVYSSMPTPLRNELHYTGIGLDSGVFRMLRVYSLLCGVRKPPLDLHVMD